ncbi:MAG: hypothetical protein ACRCYD_13110 [Plesiomonas sp.]
MMGFMCKEYYSATRRDVEIELSELRSSGGIDAETKRIILDHLCGVDGHSESDLRIVYRYNPYIKKSAMQRINTLWFLPLWIIFVAPVRYIATGEAGIDRYSKAGRIIEKLIGTF